jgi:hypothetical protein
MLLLVLQDLTAQHSTSDSSQIASLANLVSTVQVQMSPMSRENAAQALTAQ